MNNSKCLRALVFLGALGVLSESQAGMITDSVGNAASLLADAQTTTFIADLLPAQAGQSAPFDQAYGNDVLTDDVFDQSWTHSFGAISDTILSATITIGIADHDSAAANSQLGKFDLDGISFQTELDGLFEAGGGSEDTVYRKYTISLTGAVLASLADGSLLVELALQAKGLVTPLFPVPGPNPPELSDGNGAHLIFSTLVIETQDQSNGGVPTSGTLLLSILGAAGLYGTRRRRGSQDV